MSQILFYLLGLVLVAGAAGFAASLLGLSQEWMLVVAAFIFGIGLIGLARQRR